MKDGGSACATGDHRNIEPWNGMSLRDYFAAAALTGLLGQYQRVDFFGPIAADAYACADAMLAKREEANERQG